jgi:hypothetical protein
MSYYYGEASYSDYSEPAHYYDSEDTPHYCYSVPAHHDDSEDTSHYCYSVPAHHDDTTEDYGYSVYPSYSPPYIDTTHLDPSYINGVSLYDDSTISDEFHDDVPMYEDEIHPAYRDDPVDSLNEVSTWPIQPLTTFLTIDYPPNDLTTFVDSTIIDRCNTASDEELAKEASCVEEYLEEMRVWDAEDAESRALGMPVPIVNPHGQPYSESDDFRKLIHHAYYIATIQGQRIMQKAEEKVSEICDDEDMDNGDYPQLQSISPPPPPHHHHHHHTPILHLTTTKRREPRYYFGSPLRRRRQNKIRTTSPPYTRLPRPHPFSPNIHTRSHHHSHPY